MYWQGLLSDPELAGFAPVVDGRARALVRRGMEALAPSLGLHGDPPSAERIGGGRAHHPVVALPDGSRAVVRRYHRGGAVRHVNRATYFAGHRAFEEMRATERARAGGVRVPEVLAATERRGTVGYAAWLATRLIGGAVESARWMEDAAAEGRIGMLAEAGRQIGRMHRAGIAHPDLNLRNLLVVAANDGGRPDDAASDGGVLVYLIDFDGARLYPGEVPPTRRAANLLRLARSIRKLNAPVGRDGWAALRKGYGAGWPLSPADLPDLG
jgi:3-deoxy-D-manno-octulosonic acid kinase